MVVADFTADALMDVAVDSCGRPFFAVAEAAADDDKSLDFAVAAAAAVPPPPPPPRRRLEVPDIGTIGRTLPVDEPNGCLAIADVVVAVDVAVDGHRKFQSRKVESRKSRIIFSAVISYFGTRTSSAAQPAVCPPMDAEM